MPLDPKLTKFTTAPPVVASFDFTDIASGTGFENYFLMSTKDSSATDHILTPQTNFSENITENFTEAGSSEGSFTLRTDIDYDLTTQIPREYKALLYSGMFLR